MDIARVNELLKENTQIRKKIVELKRKLNLKAYTEAQKLEMKHLIKQLKHIYTLNQSVCANLTEIKAGTFARHVCKKLQKFDRNYSVQCVNLNFPKDSEEYTILKYYKGITKGKFLVVSNRPIKSTDEVSLTDFGVIPIAYMDNQFFSNMIDAYDLSIIENQTISLFETPKCNKENFLIGDVQTFNLGLAGAKYKESNAFTRLKNEIKKDFGIWSKELEQKTEKQL